MTLSKISPAFEPFMAGSGRDDTREAIVIYQAPAANGTPLRGRLRELQKKLDFVKTQAKLQKSVEGEIFAGYQKATNSHRGKTSALTARPIGDSTLPIANIQVTRQTLPALAEQPHVVAILPNQQVQIIQPQTINYARLGNQESKDGLTWGLKQLDIPQLWPTSKGRDINVAVLDTGVYGDHAALKGRITDFIVIDPLGRRITTNSPFDAGQHGTHVCGTIAGGQTAAGVYIGVAPEANLLVGGVLIGQATLQTLFEGMAWAIEKGADIINMSLGFSYYEPHFVEIFDLLINRYNVLPVVAIGNENHGNSSSPGNAANAFSVGAVEKAPRRKVEVTFFSSGASLVFPDQEPHGLVTKPDIVAPGAQVYSCIPPEKRPDGIHDYTYMDGTSMATPHVAGVAALLMSAEPAAPLNDIINVLKETAKHPQGKKKRPDNRWGYGLIQPLEALKALKS